MLYRLAGRLPFFLIYPLARLAGALMYHVVRYRRQTVADNLAHAFPELDATQRGRIAKRFYRQLCEVALEVLKAQSMRREEFLQRMPVRNPELLRRHTGDLTRPALLLTIHQGNWEWMGHGLTAAFDTPFCPVYKPLHDNDADRLMYAVRSRFGAQPIALADAGRDILRRRREPRLIGMVADQSPSGKERGYWTTFLHRDARFYLGAETIAAMADLPVLFVRCRRLRSGYYELELQLVAAPPHEREGHSITDRYVALAEAAIREEPESWLWSNRRWKRQRPQGS